jgi:hypothetical protein
MKKLKILFILFVAITLTGCSGVYNLTINEDLTVTEEVNLSLDKQDNTYDLALELIKEYGVEEDDYSIEDAKDTVKLKFTKKFESVEEYIVKSKLYTELFPEIKLLNEDRKMTLEADGVFNTNLENKENVVDSFNIELLKINIDTPLNVISNNADEITDGIYTWNIKNGDNTKKIHLELSTASVSQTYKSVIIIIVICLIIGGIIAYSILNYIKGRKLK